MQARTLPGDRCGACWKMSFTRARFNIAVTATGASTRALFRRSDGDKYNAAMKLDAIRAIIKPALPRGHMLDGLIARIDGQKDPQPVRGGDPRFMHWSIVV